ncbi:hypothetical protein SRABI06_05450 [Pseudomonas brassicacearum]|nr:hypothetical protein SRABI06_05450 [Pseudomonas brassicacearum]
MLRAPVIPCGSGLARDSGGSACIDVECADAFASKLAPTGGRGNQGAGVRHKSLWELSLLAMAVGLLVVMLDVPPSSRASSLPQGGRGNQGAGVRHKSLWELSLLAIAVGLLVVMLNVPTPSRAGSLPQGLVLNPDAVGTRYPLWERACSRKRWVCLHRGWMCRRLREQARSHRGAGVIRGRRSPQIPMGAELARDGGGPACGDVGCAAAFASRLAPTEFGVESGCCGQPQSLVGASLLAIAVGLLASRLDVPPSSRAGSLPQGLVLNPDAVGSRNPLWERACSR